MKKWFKQILTLILCLTLCVGNNISVLAANADGITFSVALDKQTIQKADVDQTVVMTLSASSPIAAESVEFEVISTDTEGTAVSLTISAITAGDNMTNTEWQYNLTDETYKASWMALSAENVENIQTIVSITFVVPADIEAGTYTVGVNGLEITKDYGDIWENGGSATTNLTITDTTAAGYTAGISATDSAVEVDEIVYIPIAVSHNTDETFNAGEITVTYDNTVLSFNSGSSTLGEATVEAGAGTLTLADYGAGKSFGTSVYTLAFDATAAASNTSVTLTAAAFTDAAGAEKEDLTVATLSPSSVTLSISEKSLAVTIDETLFKGDSTVTYGSDYTFSLVDDGGYYDYSAITATMGGNPVTVLDNNDGTYTIENVTGALEITATRTEKSYDVSFAGTGSEDTAGMEGNADSATYKTDYTFSIPETTNDYVYALESISIDGTAYTGYSSAENTYTIPGADIQGDIVITVNKTENSNGTVTVTVEGTGAGVATGEATVQKGTSYTLTVTPEAGYLYSVSATMGGETVTLTEGTDINGNATYTIANVTGAIVFDIARAVDVSGIGISQYVTLDGSIMWLVTNTTAVADGKVPTYAGNNMFWSAKYNAYCYLVVAETLDDTTAKAALDITTAAKVDVAYDNDVNETGKVDASDAQLVYNMYMAQYADVTTDVTVAKFLEADVNGDKTVNTTDAAAIISAILSTGSN